MTLAAAVQSIATAIEGLDCSKAGRTNCRIQTVSAYVRRRLRRALLFLKLTEVPVLLSEVQSGVLHLLGLISGLRRGGKGIPLSSLVVEMDLLPARRLRLSNPLFSSSRCFQS